MAAHDSRWSDRRGGRQDDRRHDYGKNARHDYDRYDAYDGQEGEDYGGNDYQDNYEQPGDLYENVPVRNIARIQITADEEDRQQQRYRDYSDHTIDRPTRGERREMSERQTESQRRTEMEKNAERTRQQAEVKRREEAEKQRRMEAEREAERARQQAEAKRREEAEMQRRAEVEREAEKKRVEAEKKRIAEARRAETQRNQHNQQREQNPVSRREPHLRYEPGAQPYQPHKQGIIDGFQQPKKMTPNDYRDEDYRNGEKKSHIPLAPPGPAGSIKAIINNLKGNVADQNKNQKQDDGRREIPRNKVSTNPFMRVGDKVPSPARTPDSQPIKNVQEVVQKMNSGEWPIRVEDDEHPRDMSRPRSQLSFESHKAPHGPHGQQKARHWEELERQSPNHRGERRGSRGEIAQRSTSSVRDVVREVAEEPQRHNSEFSERSDGAEVTTVSTDSAMGSDEQSLPLSLPFELPQGTVLRKVPDNVKELNDEAEKLLIYFKGHRDVINYLGIGLSETLWNHIRALPEASSEIVIQIARGQPAGKKISQQVTVTQQGYSPKHREQSPRSPDRRGPPSRPAQVHTGKHQLSGRH